MAKVVRWRNANNGEGVDIAEGTREHARLESLDNWSKTGEVGEVADDPAESPKKRAVSKQRASKQRASKSGAETGTATAPTKNAADGTASLTSEQ